MYKYFIKLSFVVLSIISMTATAAVINKEEIPEKIIAQLYKRHPKAEAITAEKKVHFAQDLYEVSFKDAEEKKIELFRPDGHFYAKGEIVESIFLMVPGAEQNIKAAFSDFQVKESVLIANPNSAGEEYDLLITSGGKTWSIIVDGNGNIVKKDQD